MQLFYSRNGFYKLFLLIFINTALLPQASFAQELLRNKLIPQHIVTASDTIVPALINKVATYSLTISRTNNLVKRTLNISPIINGLPDIEKKLDAFRARLETKGFQMNLRSLNSALILIKETQNKLTNNEDILSDYSEQLTRSNTDIKKIVKDPALSLAVNDTDLLVQLKNINTKANDLDSLERTSLARVNLLRNQVSVDVLQADDIVSDLNYRVVSIKGAIWGQEEPFLFEAKPSDYRMLFSQVVSEAFFRSGKIITIYLTDKWNIVTLGFLVLILITAWCMINMYRVKGQQNAIEILEPINFLKRSVVIGCLMAFFTYSPFFFGNPPMSYLHANEFFRMLALTFLLYPYLNKQSKLLWLILWGLWVCFALDDILLESAFGERWTLFITGFALVALCIKILQQKNEYFIKIPKSPATKTLVLFTLTLVTLSIFFNSTGRVSLAKIFAIAAVQCLVLAITLKVFCAMVLEAVYLQSEAYQLSRFSDFINFKELQVRFQKILWVLACIVWLVSLIRDLTLYDLFIILITQFFTASRNIGSMAFTFQSVAVFFVIIWLSSIISGFINFFFGNKKVITGKQSRIGSMMLLIRLAIWTVGFFIAVAAAGIPLTKLSLILGALGVGIGFGLQNIVNNLVSGIILAFERPIQIGDQIEVGGRSGIVQEIGVRSSTIKNGQGADIIIPNGELLSQPLINWTRHDLNKQVEFIMTFPLDINVQNVKNLLTDTLKNSEGIMEVPEPVVILQAFVDNGINIKVLFWVPDLSTAGSTRSDVMIQVLDALNIAGIKLALPITNAAIKSNNV